LLSLGPLQSLLGSINTSSCTLPLLGSSPKLDAAVQRWARLGGSGTVRVIVSAQAGLLGTVKTIVSLLGVPLLNELVGINAIVLDVDGPTLSTLACSTAVASISVDAVVGVTGDAAPAAAYSLRSTLGVPSATPNGNGVGVAVIDSGIAPSADFSNRIVGFIDFTNGAKLTSPSDAYGHGTHVAGLIAGSASLAGGAEREVRHQSHQPLARPSDLRISRQRSARACGGGSVQGGHRRRGRGRQSRLQRRGRRIGIRRDHLTGQRPLGDYRRRGDDEGHDHPRGR
jgi:subtilisin family serine protease